MSSKVSYVVIATLAVVSLSLGLIFWEGSRPEEETTMNRIEQAIGALEKSIEKISPEESEERSKLLKSYSLDCDYIFESLDRIEGDASVRLRRKALVARNNIITADLDKILGR